ncbi:MAG: bifunctional diaminohydroxyphosphoribosylaminopyrimidine deaminase/5-amino-6-(5-phosphoribosylamino)uracil reductase RibD [Epsilonproteobacteria bacterium]|nr:bifunctional diaminohydroxyphosphoribosylaminopyrimidine deaminase/5-amino-6-(5-phosphoribosylamino)uracil reductase RibD [Campylobacterota bacterium]
MVIDHNFYMSLALAEAWKYQGLTYPNPAVGAAILDKEGRLLAVDAHKKAGQPHAEVEALKSAYFALTQDNSILTCQSSQEIHAFLLQNHNNIFHGASLYTTLEPCSHVGKTPSCADLVGALGFDKVFVGSLDVNPIAACGNQKLLACEVEVETGILKDECDALLEPFVMWQKRPFIFFKWAQRLNGTFDNGIVSSKDSRTHVHALRNVCDLLVIGGESVRADRPTLDARLVDGKAPDVLIYSRQKEFDRTIPLFNVPNRRVIISDSFDVIKEYKHIMIEGGEKLFELTKEITDRYLCYVAPTIGGSMHFQNANKFEILNSRKEAEDIILWMKRMRNNG